ncbi:arylesterase [Vibrio ishigakensis]|uniref:arylesterase n=1 Tax=Vibrio ishigakensis TaxID=1481914 RepID=UPI0021C4374E|nr:arylesterase [Vibrio ishigakensis]
MLRVFSLLLLTLSFTAQSATLLVLGDSLSAGYQMAQNQAWPTFLSDELKHKGVEVETVNGSVSGDTTGNGLARLPQLLDQHQPDYVLIELGANDGLRGFPPNLIKQNLTQLINLSRDNGAEVILMQIQVPPNYGRRYTQSFEQLYPTLSEEKSVPLIPFFLAQIITDDSLMMQDGLHPKADAQPWIAEFVAENIAPIIKD